MAHVMNRSSCPPHETFHRPLDSLTGLSNRRQFFRRGEALFGLTADPCGDLAALMVDLDHFKKINDTHGHAVGDVVLREAASRMAGAVRSDDLIARCGGEEFAVLLPRTNCEVALAIAERLRQGVCSRPIDTPPGTSRSPPAWVSPRSPSRSARWTSCSSVPTRPSTRRRTPGAIAVWSGRRATHGLDSARRRSLSSR